MSAEPIQLIFSVAAAFFLLLLPGYALLRCSVPAHQLGFLSRLSIAPGITTALAVLIFTWARVFSLALGPLAPWFLVTAALLSLLVRTRRPRWSTIRRRLSRVRISDWLGGVVLVALLVLLLIVRFHATRDFVVPPGIDSAQHTIIVQLLLDNHGLFQSWAPYSQSDTFTYHFGFHAITALFAWFTGADTPFAVLIMARVIGACAVAALFGLVQLWTRSIWGGVFAVAFWELYSRHLYFFDPAGRWTLLAGLAVLPSALVLLTLFLRRRRGAMSWPLGLLASATVAGLVLTQYKTAVIFVVLATALFCGQCVAVFFSKTDVPLRRVTQISARIAIVAVLALLLVAPRLSEVMQARTGQYLRRIVVEAPPPNYSETGTPRLNAVEILRTAFNHPKKVVASSLALLGGIIVLIRRREAIWFAAGWLMVCLVMNPGLIGLNRAGLIDEHHWKYAVQTAIAVLAGLTVGLICEIVGKTRRFAWNISLMVGALALAAWGAARLPPLPQASRYVLPDDLQLMSWMKNHVPLSDMIAARSYFDRGQVQGSDAAIWLPYFTRHQTNQISLAAALEKGPAKEREKLKNFTRELYARDISTPESASWMRQEGFRWFYAGAIPPESDRKLLEEIARNPAIQLAHREGAARLFRID